MGNRHSNTKSNSNIFSWEFHIKIKLCDKNIVYSIECLYDSFFSVKIRLSRQNTIHASYVYNVRWNLDPTVRKQTELYDKNRYFEWAIKTVILNWSQTHFLRISHGNPSLSSNIVYTIEMHNIPWNVHSVDLKFGIA